MLCYSPLCRVPVLERREVAGKVELVVKTVAAVGLVPGLWGTGG